MYFGTGERSMQQPGSKPAIRTGQYNAGLDLDGVIPDAASIPAACWKQMFDEYLQARATWRGEAFRPFDIATDYRLYVDGKPRYDGVRGFLTYALSSSRRELPLIPRGPKQWTASETAKRPGQQDHRRKRSRTRGRRNG